MKTLRRKTFGISALGVVAALLVGSAVAVASPPKGKGKGVVRGVHADISVITANGVTTAFTVDTGKVTAASAGSVTLQRKDGAIVTLGLNAATNVSAAVQTGKTVTVFSSGGMAFAVLAPRGQLLSIGLGFGQGMGLARLGAQLKGKKLGVVHSDVTLTKSDGATVAFSFDRGQVTAVSATSVTIKRVDGPSVTKSISADTKVRGKLAVGGKAQVYSQGGVAKAIFAAKAKS